MQDFSGKHVAVTGGVGFLGTAVVGALLERGAVVHVPVFVQRQLDRSPHREHERFFAGLGVDLRDPTAAAQWYGSLPPLWAGVQIAGGFAMGAIEETTGEVMLEQFSLNTMTCFLSCKGAVERIRAAGQGGRLVNVTARPGQEPGPNMVAYSAAKAGVSAITRSLAEELRSDKILVNAIVPGIMDTPTNRSAMPAADRSAWSSLAAVAETVCWLSSARNQTTTGSFVSV